MIPVSILLKIGAVIFAALTVGAVIYLTVKLTVSFLKKYRKKKNSKVLVGKVKDIIKNSVKKGKTVSLDDLPDDDDVIIAEYDDEEDELVQDISVAHDVDERIERILDENDGIVIFE